MNEHPSSSPPAAEGQPAASAERSGPAAGELSVRVRGNAGWPVDGAVLTLIDQAGNQIDRVHADRDGRISAGPFAAGTYTALFAASGFAPQARTATVSSTAPTSLEAVVLERAGGIELPESGTWTIDPQHSRIAFVSQHLGISAIRGRFSEFHGTIEVAEPVENSSVTVEITTASIDTDNSVRDQHLRSSDFLETDTHPAITFSGGAPRANGTDSWALPGALVIRGVRRPVELALEYRGTADDPWGGQRAGFHATVDLRREDFNINFDERALSGIAMIGTTVRVELDIQAVFNHE